MHHKPIFAGMDLDTLCVPSLSYFSEGLETILTTNRPVNNGLLTNACACRRSVSVLIHAQRQSRPR